DFIVFFSVFTHTYPSETSALLSEAARLLEPAGVIVADAFESDLEEESRGQRAMVLLGRGVLTSQAAALAFDAWSIVHSALYHHPVRRVPHVPASDRPGAAWIREGAGWRRWAPVPSARDALPGRLPQRERRRLHRHRRVLRAAHGRGAARARHRAAESGRRP